MKHSQKRQMEIGSGFLTNVALVAEVNNNIKKGMSVKEAIERSGMPKSLVRALSGLGMEE